MLLLAGAVTIQFIASRPYSGGVTALISRLPRKKVSLFLKDFIQIEIRSIRGASDDALNYQMKSDRPTERRASCWRALQWFLRSSIACCAITLLCMGPGGAE